jgi:glycosyltransferase involved in cell wall biosynthesis
MFPREARVSQVVVRLPPQRAVWPFRLATQHALVPLLARRHTLDLLHFPMDTAAFRAGIPYVVTINDLIADVYYPAHHPRSVSPLKSRYLFAAKQRSARRAARVICPSQATAADVQRYYGVPANSIAVVADGVDSRLFGEEGGSRRATDPPYVLSVISLSPHKNVETLIHAFTRARERYRLPHELHLIGMAGTDASPVTSAINRAVEAGVPIRYLGFVPEDALVAAYRAASLFVFLSHIEGFGLPPLEAMAAGVPVVSSNASSLPEVCGDAARLVSPLDVDAAAEAIGDVLRNPEAAARLTAAGQVRARQFSWAETARKTRDVYVRVLADRTRASVRAGV